uniref:Proliferating cell nuclear antigen n=1 Tax=Parastrongyloides trichosuri TaxID=131310 RepID=A0A0N4ZVJ4_PARTI
MALIAETFKVEIDNLDRLKSLVNNLTAQTNEICIVVSEDGLRFVTNDSTRQQTIIFFNRSALRSIETTVRENKYIMIKVPLEEFIDLFDKNEWADAVCVFEYNEEIAKLRISVEENCLMESDMKADKVDCNMLFMEDMKICVFRCKITTSMIAGIFEFITRFSTHVKMAVSAEGLYFFSMDDFKNESIVLSTSKDIIELTAEYTTFHWFSSNKLKSFLPFLSMSNYCRMKLSKKGILELTIELSDFDDGRVSIQTWIQDVDEPIDMKEYEDEEEISDTIMASIE